MTQPSHPAADRLVPLDAHTHGRSMDLVADNLAQLQALFPSVFAEGKVDFEALRALLGEAVDERAERYGLRWAGKAEARRLAHTPSLGTLRPAPSESVDWDTTQNVFIEGENLEVLKLLQKSYHRQVKLIYIDPPYNTGKEFIYPDRFAAPLDQYLALTGQVGAGGQRLTANAETGGRYHTHWLNMMYPRLMLARSLLRDDGVIFVSIDDHEVHNLRHLMDEVFGAENFVCIFVWEKRTNRENRRSISSRHDYIVAYTRDSSRIGESISVLPMSAEALSRYNNPDNDPRGPWKSDPATAQAGHATKSQFYDFVAPSGRIHQPQDGRCWLYTKEAMEEAVADGRIWFGRDGDGVPRVKTYLNSKDRGLVPESIIFAEDGSTNERATLELKGLLGGRIPFDTPKPSRLIQQLLRIGTAPPPLTNQRPKVNRNQLIS